jgi:bacterial/archaeal transporter family-2 protein
MNSPFLIFLAIICGITIPLQSQFMGVLEQSLGIKLSLLVNYGLGTLIMLILLLTSGHWDTLKNWQTVPTYMYSAGALGLVIVGCIGYVVPRLGITAGFTVIVATQFIVGALIDHFGWMGATVRPLDLSKLAGLTLLLLGVRLVLR